MAEIQPFSTIDSREKVCYNISMKGFEMNKNKLAFTMAEILITLGVVGVVSAMTIPTVINKYKTFVLKKQFAKSYSMLNQVINKSIADNDLAIPACYYFSGEGQYDLSDCSSLKNSILSNLKIIKECKSNAYKNGCIPKYDDFLIPGHTWFSSESILNSNPAWVLADGNILLGYSNMFPAIMAIDINGDKLPNKYGEDIFSFSLNFYRDKNQLKLVPNGEKSLNMLNNLNLSD